jgi:hypothetical protein
MTIVVAGQADRVPGDLAGVDLAEPEPHLIPAAVAQRRLAFRRARPARLRHGIDDQYH